VEVYTDLGAAADIARLQATFGAHGIRRGPTAKHRRARSGWDSLTVTEITIAALVEEGLSNPEIAARLLVSPRTVATHVSHILKKLDVHSRTDIAREAAHRGGVAVQQLRDLRCRQPVHRQQHHQRPSRLAPRAPPSGLQPLDLATRSCANCRSCWPSSSAPTHCATSLSPSTGSPPPSPEPNKVLLVGYARGKPGDSESGHRHGLEKIQ
jgi:DNA-binding CsgD family transcriptional regulator